MIALMQLMLSLSTVTLEGSLGAEAINVEHFPCLDSPSGMIESSEFVDMNDIEYRHLFDSSIEWIECPEAIPPEPVELPPLPALPDRDLTSSLVAEVVGAKEANESY